MGAAWWPCTHCVVHPSILEPKFRCHWAAMGWGREWGMRDTKRYCIFWQSPLFCSWILDLHYKLVQKHVLVSKWRKLNPVVPQNVFNWHSQVLLPIVVLLLPVTRSLPLLVLFSDQHIHTVTRIGDSRELAQLCGCLLSCLHLSFPVQFTEQMHKLCESTGSTRCIWEQKARERWDTSVGNSNKTFVKLQC